jgi:hypothetical protein
MAEMGMGYGSECHLLRYLGRHRSLLDTKVCAAIPADAIAWLDQPFDPKKTWLDGELKGLDFLGPNDERILHESTKVWPQSGNPPNWDAVARITKNGMSEWLLVEAKANIQELQSYCEARPDGGLPLITSTLKATKSRAHRRQGSRLAQWLLSAVQPLSSAQLPQLQWRAFATDAGLFHG